MTTWKLEVESVSAEMAVDLAEVRRNLQIESDELGILSAALGVVCDDLRWCGRRGPARSRLGFASSRGMPFAPGSIGPSRLLVLIMGIAWIWRR